MIEELKGKEKTIDIIRVSREIDPMHPFVTFLSLYMHLYSCCPDPNISGIIMNIFLSYLLLRVCKYVLQISYIEK